MVLEIVKVSRSSSKSGGVGPARLDALSIFVGSVRRVRSRLSWFVCDVCDDLLPQMGKPVDGCLHCTRPVRIHFLLHLSQSDQAAAD